MGDAWLIIGIFIFAFILWVSTGGPTRPISFSGPYITPITDVKDVQVGYGEDIAPVSGGSGSHLWSVKSIFGRFEGRLTEEEIGVVSPFEGKVTFVSGAGGPSLSDPNREYVTLRAQSETDISGWRLASARSGASVMIPTGTLAPRRGGGSPVVDIVLAEGEEAVITTGRSPLGISYRENTCTGYLDHSAYGGSRCPSFTEELGEFYTGSASSYDACRSVLNTFQRCEVPRGLPENTSRECKSFIETYLTYDGCVAAHFNDTDFRGDTWRVYLGLSRELWRSDRDVIKLLDTQGRTVDIYSY